jgi:hypothetical protein
MIPICQNIPTNWQELANVSAVLTMFITAIYAGITYSLLKKSEESVAANNKLINFQIYNDISRSIVSNEFNDWVVKCRDKDLELSIEDKYSIKMNLLNPLEDLALFLEKKLISIEDVSSGYGSVILVVGNNNAVANLIIEEQREFSETFSGFESLYSEIYKRCKPDEIMKLKPTIKTI